MTVPTENEDWLIDRGDEVINKMAEQGRAALSPWERLLYCLWVADYSFRNAGDFETGEDIYEGFRDELLSLAHALGLSKTSQAFALDADCICDEVRQAETL